MKDVNSIDEIFGTEEFIRDLKIVNQTKGNYQHLNNQRVNSYDNKQENNLYLTITNTKTNQTSLYILKPYEANVKLNESYKKDNEIKQLKVDTNYKNCA